MHLRILAVFTVLCLTHCATTRSYERSLEYWKGKSESALVKEWGRPAKIEALSDGGKTLTYIKADDPHLVRDRNLRKTVVLPDCKTVFLIDNSATVLGWKYEGPDCTAH